MIGTDDDLIGLLVNSEGRLVEGALEYVIQQKFYHNDPIGIDDTKYFIKELYKDLLQNITANEIFLEDLLSESDFPFNSLSSIDINSDIGQEKNDRIVINLAIAKYLKHAVLNIIQKSSNTISKKSLFNSFIHLYFDKIEVELLHNTHATDTKQSTATPDYLSTIQNEENKYKAIFNNFFVPVILLDKENRIVDYNQAASRIFNHIQISRNYYFDDSLPFSAPREVVEKINELFLSPYQKTKVEVFIETKEGKRFYDVLLSKVIDSKNHYKGLIMTFNDLTHYKGMVESLENAMAKVEESDHMKTAFLANMSHEIRTPMNAILGFTEVMLNSNHTKKARTEFLELIRTSSRDLLRIIEDIIDIAKIESKQLKIKIKPCRLYDLVLDLQCMFQALLKRYGIQETVKLKLYVKESEKDIIINTDKERLKQVISNLLNNASKFTDKGFIEFGYKMIDTTNILFFVRDTGIGIPPDMQESIFDRFAQVEHNQGKDNRGSGLGLAICKNIVNLLGGNIWVESVQDQGSVFYFRLPVEIGEEMAEHKKAKPNVDENRLVWSDKTILIAEDDELNFLYLSELLKGTKARILKAKNGLEVISLAESVDAIDCILMDIKMPEINGIEATKYITRIRPEVPIVALTAFALDGDKERCLNAGCKAYMTKPVNKDMLFSLLAKFLKIKHVAQARSTFI